MLRTRVLHVIFKYFRIRSLYVRFKQYCSTNGELCYDFTRTRISNAIGKLKGINVIEEHFSRSVSLFNRHELSIDSMLEFTKLYISVEKVTISVEDTLWNLKEISLPKAVEIGRFDRLANLALIRGFVSFIDVSPYY